MMSTIGGFEASAKDHVAAALAMDGDVAGREFAHALLEALG